MGFNSAFKRLIYGAHVFFLSDVTTASTILLCTDHIC